MIMVWCFCVFLKYPMYYIGIFWVKWHDLWDKWSERNFIQLKWKKMGKPLIIIGKLYYCCACFIFSITERCVCVYVFN